MWRLGRWLTCVLLVAMAVAVTAPSALAFTKAHIFWDDQGAIAEANLDGTGLNQRLIPVLNSGAGPQGLAVDGQHIYWSNGGTGSIGRANLDGGAASQAIVTGIGSPEGVAVDGQHIYWVDFAAGSIVEANLDGNNIVPVITGLAAPSGIAVDSEHIYWTSGSVRIGRANLDGSNVQPNFIPNVDGALNVAVDGQHVYWSNLNAQTIGRANLDGTGSTNSFVSGAGSAWGVAAGGGHIYWTTATLEIQPTVGEANLDGTGANPTFIATNPIPRQIAVSAPTSQVAPGTPPAFAATHQATISAPLTLTVTAGGNLALELAALTFAGADPSDFIIGSDGCLAPVDPGQSCQITVNFTPQAQGVRAATLKIASNDPSGPLLVPLTGTGTTPAQGPPGPAGRPGATGPRGPAGPAGQVVCRTTLLARILCTLEFAPGKWRASSSVVHASYRIRHAGRIVATGRLTITRGRIARVSIGRLRRGHYSLLVTVGRGRHPQVLLTQAFTVH